MGHIAYIYHLLIGEASECHQIFIYRNILPEVSELLSFRSSINPSVTIEVRLLAGRNMSL